MESAQNGSWHVRAIVSFMMMILIFTLRAQATARAATSHLRATVRSRQPPPWPSTGTGGARRRVGAKYRRWPRQPGWQPSWSRAAAAASLRHQSARRAGRRRARSIPSNSLALSSLDSAKAETWGTLSKRLREYLRAQRHHPFLKRVFNQVAERLQKILLI